MVIPFSRVGGVVRYLQPDDYSCGPTAVLTVLRYHGDNTKSSKIRKVCKLTEDGAGPKKLIKGLHKLGYDTKYRKVTFGNIKEELDQGRPIIVIRNDLAGYEEEGHWSVIARYTDSNLLMADPSLWSRARIPVNRIRTRLDRRMICVYP
jgi:predicted double-glycine peptidase